MSEKHLYIRTNITEWTYWEVRHILALYWCPSVVVCPLQFYVHIFYNQLQSILPIWNILKYYFCVLAEMSSVDVNGGEAPHVLDIALDF